MLYYILHKYIHMPFGTTLQKTVAWVELSQVELLLGRTVLGRTVLGRTVAL